MTEAHIIQVKELQRVHTANHLVGELFLPAGQYLVFGKATTAARRIDGLEKLPVGFECKLVGGGAEDKCMENLHMDGFDGGNWATIALNIGVTFESDGKIEMRVTPGLTDSILFMDVTISAIKIENLQARVVPPPTESDYRVISPAMRVHSMLKFKDLHQLATAIQSSKDDC